ncbi:MAG TPA: 2-phospho-L-lactate guanylyltransferase [Thermoleophilaceae bacterium]|nr:2-phospho-L-lactate guanylyltransferase [Thermoleophilaceae bacterium]
MKTLAILPVKSFGAAKQRLSETLGAPSRQALAQAMFTDVLSAALRAPELDGIVVVTSDEAAEATATGERVRVLPDDGRPGHSRAALIGVRHALDEGYERVLVIAGDTPLVQPDELAGLLTDGPGVVIAPDRHGTGTNALALCPPDAIEPSFGPGSCERHVAAAREAGVAHRVAHIRALALDVDTPADLAELATELDLRPGQPSTTRDALHRLDRDGQPVRVAQAPA